MAEILIVEDESKLAQAMASVPQDNYGRSVFCPMQSSCEISCRPFDDLLVSRMQQASTLMACVDQAAVSVC